MEPMKTKRPNQEIPVCTRCGINNAAHHTETAIGIQDLCDICLDDETKGLPVEYLKQEVEQEQMYENLIDGKL